MAMTLGRYEIVRELGKGAMGIVYEALDPAIGRRVALKTILKQQGISADEEAMRQERFQREARAAGVLSHPNIVTVYDVGEDRHSGTTFFAMEFITGDDLSKVLRSRGPLSAEEVVSIVAQVADALDYAHKSGIVHRDIKPANVVLMPSGRVKVTDFGIAKLETSTLTQTGAYLGTPTFMAPEMISGRGVDGRADQFSLGVVAYQLLTGAKPFPGENLATLSYQIVNKDPTPVRSHRPDLPEEVEQVFLNVLAKRAEDRYESCSDFVSDLRGVVLPHDEATLDYTDETRAAGPGSAKVRAIGPGSAKVRVAGPGSTKVRAPGPGTGKTRTAAPGPSDPSMATRLESTQSTLATVGGTGGVLIGVAAGAAVLLGLVVVVAAWYFLRPAPVRGGLTPRPTVSPSPTARATAATPAPTETPQPIPTVDPAEKARKDRNDQRWRAALDANASGNYDEAIAQLTELLQDDPAYPQALALLETVRRARAEERQRQDELRIAEERQREEERRQREEAARRTPQPTQVAVATPSPTPKETPDDDGPHGGTSHEESDHGVQGVGEGSTLSIKFEHRLPGGTIKVFVDGTKVIDTSFSGSRESLVKIKKFSLFTKESTFTKSVSVAPGEHDVKVEITGDDLNTSGHLSNNFKEGKTRLLLVGVGNVDREIELEWD